MLVFFKWRFFFLQVNLGEEADGGEERCQLISLGTPGEGRPVASPRKEQSNTLLCLGLTKVNILYDFPTNHTHQRG